MRGWSDDEGEKEAEDWLAKRRKASAAAGRTARGRGFTPGGGEVESVRATGGNDDEGVVEYDLQKEYTRYAIDPDDTWSPQRRPYAELDGRSWEFSGAWSLEPDEGEQNEVSERRSYSDKSCGVAVWRVEHGKGGDHSSVRR